MASNLRISPAAHMSAEMQQLSESTRGALTLRELPFKPQLGIRAIPGNPAFTAIEQTLTVALPTQVGDVTGDAQGLHVFWLSPDEFLAVDVSAEQQPGAAGALKQAIDGLPGQVIDLSANRTILELTGAVAHEVLEKGCRADLHPAHFEVGTAIATQVGQAPVMLHRAAEETYRLYPRASFAEYMVQWLLDASAEFTYPASQIANGA